MRKIPIAVLIFSILLMTAFSSACVSNPFGKPDVRVSNLDSKVSDFDLSGKIQFTITFQTYNQGDGIAKNVNVIIDVLDASGKTLKSVTVFVGNIEPGDIKSSTTKIWVDSSAKSFRARKSYS